MLVSNTNIAFVLVYQNYFFSQQKQPPKVFWEKRCSLKFRVIHKKTPVLDYFFKKVACLKDCKFVRKDSKTFVFLRILRIFKEHLFWRTSANSCFYCNLINCEIFSRLSHFMNLGTDKNRRWFKISAEVYFN